MIVLESGQIPASTCLRGVEQQIESDEGFHWPAHLKSSPGRSVSLDGGSSPLTAIKWELWMKGFVQLWITVVFLRRHVREALGKYGLGVVRQTGRPSRPFGLGYINWKDTLWFSLPTLSILRLPWSVLTFAILVGSGRWASSGVKGSVKNSTGKVSRSHNRGFLSPSPFGQLSK